MKIEAQEKNIRIVCGLSEAEVDLEAVVRLLRALVFVLEQDLAQRKGVKS